MKIIDCHAHLTDNRLEGELANILASFDEDNIAGVISCGYDMESSLSSFEIAKENENVYCTLGIHPHDSKYATTDNYNKFQDIANFKLKESGKFPVSAIGEIGLDYFYDHSEREIQRRVFLEQLELAHFLKLPVQLHIREAYEDSKKILFENKHLLQNGILLHCYSGSSEYVKIYQKLDAFFSFGGAITFKNAKHNVESLKEVPIDRLLLETDCPYMTPMPFRGKTNYPKYINLVAEKVGEILQIEKNKICEITSQNTLTLFDRIVLNN